MNVMNVVLPSAVMFAQRIDAGARAVGDAGATFAAAVREAYAAEVFQRAAELAIRADFGRAPAADAKEQSQRAGTWRVRFQNALAHVLAENTFVKVSVKSGKASKLQELAGVVPELAVTVKIETREAVAELPEHIKAAQRLAKSFAELLANPNVDEEAKAALREAESSLSRAALAMVSAMEAKRSAALNEGDTF